jgi:hypothetical protein
VLVVLALLSLAALGLQAVRPPPPAAPDAPADQFSAQRALLPLARIAAKAHPVGTEENAAVRAYLSEQLEALGLELQEQAAQGIHRGGQRASVGNVHNLLARLAGAASDHAQRKAVLLVAHYDSTPHGPGAGDDGAGVAALLETLRALKHGAPLQNDLIVLLTDGEEAGLLGAEAFVAEHPWARQAALAINLEFRGNSGPVMMFETSVGNGRLVDALAQVVPHPVANSLNYEIYKLLPNDTDLSVFKRKGLAGMNFAGIEGHPAYHTELDTPAHLSAASLQHEGETVLALARHFGNLPLQEMVAPDQVYFDFPGLGLVHYPAGAALPMALALALLAGGVSLLAWRRRIVRLAEVLLGACAQLVACAVLAGAAQLLWMAVLRLHPGYQTMAQGEPYNSSWYLLAIVALTVAAFHALQAWLAVRVRGAALMLGSALLWLLLLGVLVWRMPGASFLLTWPLLAMLLAFGWCAWRPALVGWRLRAVLLLGAAPGVLLFAPLARAVFFGLGPGLCGVMVALLVLLLGLLGALLAPSARVLRFAALAAGIGLLVAGENSAGFDPSHPQQASLFYLQDGQSGKAFWLSSDTQLNRWSAPLFAGVAAPRALPTLFGQASPQMWAAPAPPLDLAPPQVDVLSDQRSGALRKLVVDVLSEREAPMMFITLEGATVLRSSVNGRSLTLAPRADWSVGAYAIGADGIRLSLEVEAGKPFLIRVRDRSFGLPPGLVPARPPGLIAQPFGSADSTQAEQVRAFP